MLGEDNGQTQRQVFSEKGTGSSPFGLNSYLNAQLKLVNKFGNLNSIIEKDIQWNKCQLPSQSLSYRSKTLPQLYSQHEKEKKSQYMNRVLQLEKGSFVPLVFTTTGGMAPEAKRFIKRLAAMISAKTKEDYSQVISNIRTRLSMDIMRSVLVGVRGVRGKAKKAWTAPLSSVSFNLIPEEKSYEG